MRHFRSSLAAHLLPILGFLVLLSISTGGLGQDYSLPIRWCVIGDDANGNGVADAGEEGAPAFTDPSLVGEPDTDNVLWRRHERISDRTLIPQADVTLRSALWNIVADATLNFPIIEDPDTSDPDHEYGDLLSSPRDERDLARDACIAAWQDDHGVDDIGIIAIVARRLVDADGNAVSNGVGRLGGRLLWVQDNAFVLPDPAPDGDLRDPFDGTLGHEFGHAHPAALDHTSSNVNIMRTSPADVASDGVRDNFDLSSSIVDTDGDTVDQIDLINANSPSVPGCKIFGTNTDCSTRSDAQIDPLGDVEIRFLDLRLVALADLDDTSTRILLEVAGPFDEAVLTFDLIEFLTFIDLDGDPSTGGAPEALGFETSFVGAEAVVRVELNPVIVDSEPSFAVPERGTAARLPVLSTETTFWRFDPERENFVEVPSTNIRASLLAIIDIIDPIAPGGSAIEELVGHSIEVILPNALLGPMVEQPRLQAVSRGVRGTRVIMDRLDESTSENGVFYRLVFPTFPLCDASPDPVEAGMTLRVTASGLLADREAKVILGDDRIGEALTSAGGELVGDFSVPSDTREGKRLLTVGITGTALTADCPITVRRSETRVDGIPQGELELLRSYEDLLKRQQDLLGELAGIIGELLTMEEVPTEIVLEMARFYEQQIADQAELIREFGEMIRDATQETQ